jgi:hypothetical protein
VPPLGGPAGLDRGHHRGRSRDGPCGRRRRLLLVPEPPARRAGRRGAGGLGRRRAGAAVRALLRLPPAPGRQGAGGALPESEVPEGVHRHLRQADRLDRRAAGPGQADLGRGQGHRCAASGSSTPSPTWRR